MHSFYWTEQHLTLLDYIMLHLFHKDISSIPLPERFTFPFHYVPHPLCIYAAEEVQAYLASRTDWKDELQQGKMFGVLVVRTAEGHVGFLAAFSGNLQKSNKHDYFVPPVYDLLNPEDHFKNEEENISQINRKIAEIETCHHNPALFHAYITKIQQETDDEIRKYREGMKNAQKRRNELRQQGNLTDTEQEALNQQSRLEKNGLKRIKSEKQAYMKQILDQAKPWQDQLQQLKDERKSRSLALQQWAFRKFIMYNASGQKKDLCDIFAACSPNIPPAGSGECAAPKLLQYAYQNRLEPIAMAEFWWGNSPKGEIRHHGHYYPACKHKCEPILNFMLQGLNVEPNPLLSTNTDADALTTIYEDEYLIVVNKPAGMLSVPGKNGQSSVLSILQERYPQATGPILVHRLDMDTSGLLLAAKDKHIHAQLQVLFEQQCIKKRYIALLDGSLTHIASKGFIRLPLRPDYDNRPIQLVDYENGKPSVTRYEILEVKDGQTRIAYYPETGRTHQLRVHSAHPDGMNSPILGDTLYGQPSQRLYLHAEMLEFRHPITHKIIRVMASAPF